MSSNKEWTCDGKPKNPEYQGSITGKEHESLKNYGNSCIDCGLPKEAVVAAAGVVPEESYSSNKIWILLLLPLLLAFFGFAAYSSIIKPRLDRQSDGSPFDKKCDLQDPKQNPELYSTGERTLFPTQSNLDKNRGLEEFRNENYTQAEKYFQQAKDAARNDPEPLIYKNNAKARLQGCPLTLALVVPITDKGTSAKEMMRGVADAQEEFNNDPKNQGDRLLQVMVVNDANEPEVAKKVAQYIANNQAILGVIGHNSSNATGAALPIYEKANLPTISPTSTSTSLESPVFFRTVPSDAETARVIGKYAQNELKANKVAIFYDESSSYSKSLLKELLAILPEDKIVTKIDLNKPDLDLAMEVQKSIKNSADTAILFPSTKSTSVAIRVAIKNYSQQSTKMRLLGGDALYNPDTLINGGKAVKDLIVAVPLVPSSSYDNAAKHWGGRVNWRTAASFDATDAFSQSIKDMNLSKDITRKNILEQLSLITVGSDEELWQFENRERNTQPSLAQATKRSKEVPAPKDADFGFKPL